MSVIGEAFRKLISRNRKEISACRVDAVGGFLTVDSDPEAEIISPLFEGLTPFLRDVAAFEQVINRADITEWDLQRFFERHPMFLLGSQYQRLHNQVALFKDEARS